jgi:hypothetical protein
MVQSRSLSRVHTRISCEICRDKFEFRQRQTHSWRKTCTLPNDWYEQEIFFLDSRDGLFDCFLLVLLILQKSVVFRGSWVPSPFWTINFI